MKTEVSGEQNRTADSSVVCLVGGVLLFRVDGDGYWATKEGYDNDSNVWDLNKPAWATHVLWLNR